MSSAAAAGRLGVLSSGFADEGFRSCQTFFRPNESTASGLSSESVADVEDVELRQLLAAEGVENLAQRPAEDFSAG